MKFKKKQQLQPNIAVKTKVVNATRQRKLYNTLFSRVDLVKFHHDEVQYVLYIMLGKQSLLISAMYRSGINSHGPHGSSLKGSKMCEIMDFGGLRSRAD